METEGIDGDFACSTQCETQYIKQKDNFLNNIVKSSKLTKAWLLGTRD